MKRAQGGVTLAHNEWALMNFYHLLLFIFTNSKIIKVGASLLEFWLLQEFWKLLNTWISSLSVLVKEHEKIKNWTFSVVIFYLFHFTSQKKKKKKRCHEFKEGLQNFTKNTDILAIIAWLQWTKISTEKWNLIV